ncbi:MAG: peptidoglycan-associated lipoprotein Pal [Nitrospirae bacterium]|nr:peptidoglycan-associated lipoprotein Pal [Nitrospirota bacterium]
MKKYWIFFLLIALAVSGCQQKTTAKPDDTQMQAQKDGAQTKKDVDRITDGRDGSKVESVDSKDGSSSKSGEEKEGMFKDVLFDYDKYDVKESFQPVIKSIAAWMTKNSSARLSIEGHCDDRGTNEYNLALGDRRAKSVRDSLVAVGVSSSRLDIISYGEEKPLCREETEDCWAKNRRAHFVVLVTKAGK